MKTKNRYALAALALPALVTQPVFALAADKDQEKSVVLEKIVVTDKKPAMQGLSKTEITREEIMPRQAQVQDTAKLLADIPGLNLQAGGGVSSLPVIHGLNDDRIKIDVNGMTIMSACANHMNPPLSYIDRTNIGTITVLKGITPVSMGGDSIGGTVTVQSPEPVFAQGNDILLNGKLSGFYSSNGDAFGGSMAVGIANKNVRLDYTGSHSQSGNHHDGNNQVVKSTAYENQNHAFNLAFKFDKHLLEFKGGQQHIPYQGFPTQRMDMTNNDSIFGNVHYKGTFDWGNLDGRLYLENTSHSMDILDDKLNSNPPNAPGMHSKMPMDVRGRNFGYKIQAEIPFDEHNTLRVGNEFHSNRLNEWWTPVPPFAGAPRTAMGGMWPNDFINLNNATRDRVGTYAEWEANWSPQWRTQLGVRYDHTMTDAGNVSSYKDAILTPTNGTVLEANRWNALNHRKNYDTFDVTALLQFTPNKISQYEFGYARKGRAPNIYELYPWSTSAMMMSMIGSYGDGNGYVGNMDLKPEIAHNLSFTAAFHDDKNDAWDLKVTPYLSLVENFIDADRCTTATCALATQPTNGFYFLKLNNRNARLWGFDLSGRADLYKSDTFGLFSTRATMDYVRGERMDGGNLYHMMPFNTRLSLDHKLDGWKSSIDMQFVDSKTHVQAIRNELKTPSYILLNAKTGYQWKHFSIDVGLDNILNKQYYHPLGGAYAGDYYAMSITMPDKGFTNNRNLPSMGRSVFVGVTLTY